MTSAVVHQTLHGYSDGHRLIEGSLSLTGAEARTMLVMSDLSGPGVKPGPSGYLTGYALEGVGKYVLARTWSAPEMPRPGCVWTHSLLIDNADLATIRSLDGIMDAFRRPDSAGVLRSYAEPANVTFGDDEPTPLIWPVSTGGRAAEVLNALYAAPGKAVVIQAADEVEDERLVTGIWLQQWPRLRRSFAFCTLTKVDRSLKGEALDLQMVPTGERQLRSKFANAVNPADVPQEPALGGLVSDLMWPTARTSQLKEFLRRAGGDVDGGRRAMLPLCKIYDALFDNERPDLTEAVAAFGDLDRLGRRQARSVRLAVTRQAITALDTVDERVFDFVMDTLADFPSGGENEFGPLLGNVLWRRSPSRFLNALDDAGPLGRASLQSLSQIPAEDLVACLKDDVRMAERLAELRPDLLVNSNFWKLDVDGALLDRIGPESVDKVVRALIAAGRADGAQALVPLADPLELARALDDDHSDSVVHAWLQAVGKDPNQAAAILASGGIRRGETLVSLARAMEPDDAANEYGEDPWWIAVRSATQCQSRTDADYLAAFLMARALGSRSRSAAELMRQAYTRLFRAVERSELSYDAERLFAFRLDWGSWLDWDRASRLRTTVVDHFVEKGLDPETFGRLSDDHRLTEGLLKEAARTSRGRRYLEEVRKRIKDAPDKGVRARADFIAKLVR